MHFTGYTIDCLYIVELVISSRYIQYRCWKALEEADGCTCIFTLYFNILRITSKFRSTVGLYLYPVLCFCTPPLRQDSHLRSDSINILRWPYNDQKYCANQRNKREDDNRKKISSLLYCIWHLVFFPLQSTASNYLNICFALCTKNIRCNSIKARRYHIFIYTSSYIFQNNSRRSNYYCFDNTYSYIHID